MRCSRTYSAHVVAARRCRLTWWRRSWCSRPSRGSQTVTPARALRDRISWKVACGLALDDEGFDYSVLTYWPTRLRTSERPERIFDAVRSVIDATGVLER